MVSISEFILAYSVLHASSSHRRHARLIELFESSYHACIAAPIAIAFDAAMFVFRLALNVLHDISSCCLRAI